MRKYQKKAQCEVCMKYRNISMFDDLSCNHKICQKCLGAYIEENTKTRKIQCPIGDCDEKLPKKIVKKYIAENTNFDEEKEERKMQSNKIMAEYTILKENIKKAAVDTSFDQLNADGCSYSCYFCKKEGGLFVKYDCNHFLCEDDFNNILGAEESQYEKLIECHNNDCIKKGIASLDSIMKLSIPDFKKQGFQKVLLELGNQNKEDVVQFCQICFKKSNIYDSLKM